MLDDVHRHNYPPYSRSEVLPYIPDSAVRVLDVGCGEGAFGSLLVGRELYGVEPNPRAADIASGHYRKVFAGYFPEAVPEGTQYDCIIFNDVLEHMIDPWSAVRQSVGLLSPGGYIVASIPNMRYMPVLKALVVSADWTYEDEGVLDRTHLRWFTARTMRELFEMNGFQIEAFVPINYRPGWKSQIIRHIPRFGDLPVKQFVIVARPVALPGS